MSNSVRPHRRQPTRLPRPWDSPGKNTGVGCHFLLQSMKVKVKSLSHVRLFVTPWTAPTKLLRPWDFPGKSTGVGCHCLLHHCDIIPFKTHCTSIWRAKLRVYSNTHTQCVYICVCVAVCLLYIDPFSLFQAAHILSADPKGSLICSGYPHPLLLAALKCGLGSPGFLLIVIFLCLGLHTPLVPFPYFLKEISLKKELHCEGSQVTPCGVFLMLEGTRLQS